MEKIANPKIEEYEKLLLDDLKLNDMNIKERSLLCPTIKAKWLKMFFKEQEWLRKLEVAKDILIEKYILEHGKQGIAKFKIQNEMEQNEEIIKLKKEIESQKELIRYLDGVNKIVSNFGFDIKNVIDLLKLENV